MKLWYSYLKELKLSSKGFYFYIEVIMTVIILVILLFVIPENMTSTEVEYIYAELPESINQAFTNKLVDNDLDRSGVSVEMEIGDRIITTTLYEPEGKEIYLFSTKQDMIEATQKERPLIGASITWDSELKSFQYEYYLQGYESSRLENLYRIIHSKNLEELVEKSEQVQVRSLETGFEQLNSRQLALPSLITFNGSLMGLFIIVAYIFLDKQEGVIKAYAVTASKVWIYLMSKALTLMTVTLITTLVIVVPVMGTQPNYPALVLLLLTSAFFASALGLFVSSFFDNMTQAFGAIYIVMMLFIIPAIAYFIPSWEPFWVKLIPIHYLIQGFKETIMVNGDLQFVLLSSSGFFVGGIIIFLLANLRFKGNLTV